MKDLIETMAGSILQRSLTRGDLYFSFTHYQPWIKLTEW